jgi:hypothetical protein
MPSKHADTESKERICWRIQPENLLVSTSANPLNSHVRPSALVGDLCVFLAASCFPTTAPRHNPPASNARPATA